MSKNMNDVENLAAVLEARFHNEILFRYTRLNLAGVHSKIAIAATKVDLDSHHFIDDENCRWTTKDFKEMLLKEIRFSIFNGIRPADWKKLCESLEIDW